METNYKKKTSNAKHFLAESETSKLKLTKYIDETLPFQLQKNQQTNTAKSKQ